MDKRRNDDYILEQIKKHPNLTPKNLQIHCIKEKIDAGDVEGARSVSRKLADRHHIQQLRGERISIEQNADAHSFAAVAILKEACDIVDPFHIFEMNDGRMNDNPDFVFKTFRISGEVGLMMDQECNQPNPLQAEDAYFDGAHSCCMGFISLGLWLYYRSMWQLIQLATMEVRGETQENIGKFWTLWNRALQMVGEKDPSYVFNPQNIMVDNAGANYCSVQLVFGFEFMVTKVVACQWHFLHNMELLAHAMTDKDHDEFLELCSNLLEATMIPEYQMTTGLLACFIKAYPQVEPKLTWWHVRRWHVFGACSEMVQPIRG